MMRQILIVTTLNIKTLRLRFWTSMVVVVGMAVTIGVLLSLMSLATGMQQAYINAGDPRRAIIVSLNADSESQSSIGRDKAPLIIDAPGIAKDKDGKPFADREFSMGMPVLRKNGTRSYTTVRGFGDHGIALRPELHLVAGRMFQVGKREMIVGVGSQNMYLAMNIGDRVILPGGEWQIVGVYTTGDVMDGQLIGDTETLMSATHRSNYNSILVRLISIDSLSTLKRALTSNPALSVNAERHSDWYKKAARSTVGLMIIAGIVGAVMAIGALFGCLNTMYAMVSTRGREIATLRALGFSAFPVAVSVLLESVLLSVFGALIGATIAWALYNGNQKSFGSMVFVLTVSQGIVGSGILCAGAVAILGGLPPSVRAALRPVAEALRMT